MTNLFRCLFMHFFEYYLRHSMFWCILWMTGTVSRNITEFGLQCVPNPFTIFSYLFFVHLNLFFYSNYIIIWSPYIRFYIKNLFFFILQVWLFFIILLWTILVIFFLILLVFSFLRKFFLYFELLSKGLIVKFLKNLLCYMKLESFSFNKIKKRYLS